MLAEKANYMVNIPGHHGKTLQILKDLKIFEILGFEEKEFSTILRFTRCERVENTSDTCPYLQAHIACTPNSDLHADNSHEEIVHVDSHL